MRKLFIVLATIFAILGIVFTILPLGTLALLPIGFALLFGFIAYTKSGVTEKNTPKWILIVAAISLLAVFGKKILFPDTVAKDVKFEQRKIETKKEDLKDLEELEGL